MSRDVLSDALKMMHSLFVVLRRCLVEVWRKRKRDSGSNLLRVDFCLSNESYGIVVDAPAIC